MVLFLLYLKPSSRTLLRMKRQAALKARERIAAYYGVRIEQEKKKEIPSLIKSLLQRMSRFHNGLTIHEKIEKIGDVLEYIIQNPILMTHFPSFCSQVYQKIDELESDLNASRFQVMTEEILSKLHQIETYIHTYALPIQLEWKVNGQNGSTLREKIATLRRMKLLIF